MSVPVAVGVLGGMGPAATIDFMMRVLRATPAEREQDHLRLIVDNNPGVPDRNAAIRGEGPSPGPVLAEMARGLARAGAEFLVMPCNTAHAFRDDIKAATQLPFIDMIEETASETRRLCPHAKRVGLLATSGCVAANLYPAAFEGTPTRILEPKNALGQSFMQALYRIKLGHVETTERQQMRDIAERLVSEGAEAIIVGCTEVPLVLDQSDVSVPLIVSTDVLVARTIGFARASLRPA